MIEREFKKGDVNDMTERDFLLELEELLLYRAELGAADAKFIGKKLVLKGDVQLCALYRSGEGLNQARFELPFSQILDMGELPEEAEPEVTLGLLAKE